MPTLADTIRGILASVTPTTGEEATRLLKGLPGRGTGGYVSSLCEWLNASRLAFAEPVSAEDVDHPNDHGLDAVLEGGSSRERVGFQVKSDTDLASRDFTGKLKAQLTDARAWSPSLVVVVLACTPSEKNQQKYKYIISELRRYPASEVCVLDPMRAAGLLKHLATPLTTAPLVAVSWEKLFVAANQDYLLPLYLHRWPGVTPVQRFKAPAEYDEIKKAIESHVVTVVVGPPAAGKTFLCVQLLWQAFTAGQDIRWVAPSIVPLSDGPVVLRDPPDNDISVRVDLLSRTLGLRFRQPPLDPTDFVAGQLQPNGLVYIEDPFGKTPADFRASLHSFKFFDLNAFVAALGTGGPRDTCRIVISSREGLFEKWLAEGGSIDGKSVAVVRLSKQSYSGSQRAELARLLMDAAQVTLDDDDVALVVAKCETPYEVEGIVDALRGKPGADVGHLIEKRKQTLVATAIEAFASSDSLKLFLFTLKTLSTDGHGRNNFRDWFLRLHMALSLGTDPEGDLRRCLAECRHLVVLLQIGENDPERSFHLEPAHSTVMEAVEEYLRDNASEILRQLARVLPQLDSEDWYRFTQARIALDVLDLGVDCSDSTVADAILGAICYPEALDITSIYAFTRLWPKLHSEFREHALTRLEANPRTLTRLAGAARGTTDTDLGWRLVRGLLFLPALGAGRFHTEGHPWAFLFDNLASIPIDISTGLSEVAAQKPALFSYAVGDLCVSNWGSLPNEAWRAAVVSEATRRSMSALDKTLSEIGERWTDVAPELREHFDQCANSDSIEARASAAMASLLHYERAPQHFRKILERAARDASVRVPLHVFDEALGDNEHDQWFAQELLAGASETVAAAMVAAHIYTNGRPEWKVRLQEECVAKGGEFARAVLKMTELQRRSWAGDSTGPTERWEEESEPVKLAWVWAYANSAGQTPPLTQEELVRLCDQLTEPYNQLAFYILGHQMEASPPLPDSVRQWLTGVMSRAAWIATGAKQNDSHRKRSKESRLPEGRVLPGYPANFLASHFNPEPSPR